MDFNVINQTLTELNIGKVDFKARGVSVNLKKIFKSVRGEGLGRGLVIFTKVADMQIEELLLFVNIKNKF